LASIHQRTSETPALIKQKTHAIITKPNEYPTVKSSIILFCWTYAAQTAIAIKPAIPEKIETTQAIAPLANFFPIRLKNAKAIATKEDRTAMTPEARVPLIKLLFFLKCIFCCR